MSVSESYIRKTVAPEASLAVAGCHQELPVRKGTLGPDVVDISTLYQDTGRFTYDPSFTSTASCESKITFIDFDKGIVLYRGYPIEQLAEHSTGCSAIIFPSPTPVRRKCVRLYFSVLLRFQPQRHISQPSLS